MFLLQKIQFEHHHGIQYIQINQDGNCHFKHTFLIFFDQFCPKRIFLSKAGQMNVTIKFSISEFKVITFFLNRQF